MWTDLYQTIDQLRDAQQAALGRYARARRGHYAALANQSPTAVAWGGCCSAWAERVLALSAAIDRALDAIEDDLIAPEPAPEPEPTIFNCLEDGEDLLAPIQV